MRGQRAVGTIEEDSGLALNQQAQIRELVLEDGAAGGQSVHGFSVQFSVSGFQLLDFPVQCELPAAAMYSFPESFPASRAATFISFSSEEKRCRTSWIRSVIFRTVSSWARACAERLPGSSSRRSEFPSTEVSALLRPWRISRM